MLLPLQKYKIEKRHVTHSYVLTTVGLPNAKNFCSMLQCFLLIRLLKYQPKPLLYLAFVKNHKPSWAEDVIAKLQEVHHIMFHDAWDNSFDFETWDFEFRMLEF